MPERFLLNRCYLAFRFGTRASLRMTGVSAKGSGGGGGENLHDKKRIEITLKIS